MCAQQYPLQAGNQILPVSNEPDEEQELKARVSRAIGNLKGSAAVLQPQTTSEPVVAYTVPELPTKRRRANTIRFPSVQMIRVGMEDEKAMDIQSKPHGERSSCL